MQNKVSYKLVEGKTDVKNIFSEYVAGASSLNFFQWVAFFSLNIRILCVIALN